MRASMTYHDRGMACKDRGGIDLRGAHADDTSTHLLEVAARFDVTGVHTLIAHDGRAHGTCKSTRDTLA
jgi:hypothetical protein